MALKQDEDFLRFLTMGAASTAAVLDALSSVHGHRMVELERYATANKIWASKIKRLRLADLLCLDCGLRVEVRAKSKLAIRMSHSETPGREWDAGLRDEDLVAFVAWRQETRIPSPCHHFFQVGDMRATACHASLGPRKAASEGAERDMTWPATVPGRDGHIIDIDSAAGKARFRFATGRMQSYRLRPEGVPVHPYVSEGQHLIGGEQFLFGCVKSPQAIHCPGPQWNFRNSLDATDATDRYVAVKAAGINGQAPAEEGCLMKIVENKGEDFRIRLEALGSLARMNPSAHVSELWEWISNFAPGSKEEVALSMEGIFILSEQRSREALEALATLASDSMMQSEARSAAVWGLGAAGADDAGRVLPFIADADDNVALHAIAGIGALDESLFGKLREMLLKGSDREASSACELLIEEGEPGIRVLLEAAQSKGRASLWGKAALGRLSEADVRQVAAGHLNSNLEATLAPMWTEQSNWLKAQQTTSPVDFLRQQCVRHLGRRI